MTQIGRLADEHGSEHAMSIEQRKQEAIRGIETKKPEGLQHQ
jgi:hypothetical protein